MTVTTRSLRNTLLIGVSMGALLVAGVAHPQSGLFGSRGGSADPAAAAARAVQAQATRVAETSSASQRAVEAFRRAAATRSAMSTAQATARAAASSAQSNIPNGLGQGGLQVANGVAFGADGKPIDGTLWIGAKGPVQSAGEGGRTTVAVEQTQQNAILTWDSFNVGRETDLSFRQGGADWVALNRVTDVNADPSKILGTIKAAASVYILNRNGVIFGGASQVNVRNLIAASANITNADFLERGIYSRMGGGTYLPSFTGAGGAVRVEAGAQIKTNTPTSVTAGGGFALLMGSSVTNEGSIATSRGQTTLAAGDDFILRRGFGTEENLYSTTRGNEVRGLVAADSANGTVVNAGQIEAAQGDITLAGRTIRQDGVALATTSVNQRGTIHLLNSASDALGSVTLGANSLTTILPELDSSDTALNGQRDALIAQSAAADIKRGAALTGGFDDRALLADRLDQGRVEIVTGGNVAFQGGSQTIAQGGQVAVQANAGRITVADGARIDVSGVMGVALDMESNAIKVNVQGNELRDSPANRDGTALKSQDVWIDVRDLVLLPAGTGGYSSDRWYTPGGLLEVGGHLANMAHGIGEWTAVGGTITLAAKEVVAQKGAIFDISGGSLDYAAGYVASTRVLGADGRLYDLRNAPANLSYVAVGNAFRRAHARWGDSYTEIYAGPLFSRGVGSRFEEGYSVGRDAGALILSAPTVLMEGTILADALNGAQQTNARADGVTDSYKLGQHTFAQAGSLTLGRYGITTSSGLFPVDVRIGAVADVTAGLGGDTALPADRIDTAWFDAARLDAAKLGGITLATRGGIAITGDLTLADGGALKLVAPTIDIAANVTARSGSVSATNLFAGGALQGNLETLLDNAGASRIALGQDKTIDVRGVWVNTALNAADTGKLGLIDGGTVYLASTHDVVLAAGSRIDASSGGAQLPLGETRGGRGGDISLLANLETSDAPDADGLLTFDGTVAGFGVSGGGTLKLSSGTAIAIGGKLLATDGVLGAGVAAPVDLVLTAPYQLRIGEALPIDYTTTITVALPGSTVPVGGAQGPFTIAQDWVPQVLVRSTYQLGSVIRPEFEPGRSFIEVQPGGQITFVGLDQDGVSMRFPLASIPAGTIITSGGADGGGKLLAGLVLDPAIFPDGVRVAAYNAVVKAGSPSPVELTLASGTKIASGIALARAASVKTNLQLDTTMFQSGFSNYDITGRNGVVVTAGTTLDVTMPVYRVTAAAGSTLTGASPAAALELWTPPLYQEDPVAGVLTPRDGASVTLSAARTNTAANASGIGAGGPVSVGANAVLTVDPGQAISLNGSNVAIDGRLNAWGGTIALNEANLSGPSGAGSRDPGVIRIGADAVLDAAARAAVARDQYGNRYGLVANGGTISLGGVLDWEDTGEAFAPNTFVVIEKGALLDASGTSATIDLRTGGITAASRPMTVASDGGTIVAKSNQGLYLDGTLRATAGGAGAAGGTLALALAAPYYTLGTTGEALNPREFVVSQVQGDSLSAGWSADTLTVGHARLGADRVAAGGFGNLSLLVDGPLSMDGDVSLAVAQSLRLYAGGYALANDAAADSRISLRAGFVRLAGATSQGRDAFVMPKFAWGDRGSSPSDATFGVKADLIEIRDTVGFGASNEGVPLGDFDRRGFGTVDLNSSGDIRLLRGQYRKGAGVPDTTALETLGDVVLTAAQIYPATDAHASIVAGYLSRFNSTYRPGTSITVRRAVQGDVALPYSTLGQLDLDAETVNQGGIVRAPFGSISLGTFRAQAQNVNLLAGSITSVSGAGLIVPYGGTVDGIAYSYAGREIELGATQPFGKLSGSIGLGAAHVTTEAGSIVDLSGGGTITGAGFVSGRGGSVDILKTPLANAGPNYGFSSADNAVYAIVPSSTAAYAPVAPDKGAGDPAVGQQITIPAGVPGLPAGTYTLMPSTFALAPGAFRVEIGAGGQTGLIGVTALGNGSYVAAATLGIANTGIRAALPNQIVLTPADIVRTHSGYNESTYDSFARADAAKVGVPRGRSTVDAGDLQLNLGGKAADDLRSALSIAGVVKQAPLAGSDGFASTVSVLGVSEVLAIGQDVTSGLTGASIYAADLSALDASRLAINVSLSSGGNQTRGLVDVVGSAQDLVVRSGASIVAGDVLLGASRRYDSETGLYVDSNLTIEEGASIIARGGTGRGFDSRDGYVFSGESALIVSNGQFDFMLAEASTALSSDPSAANSGVNIRIGACVTDACDMRTRLVSSGTIVLGTNRALEIADNVSYGAKNLVLGVATLDLGETADLAAVRDAGQLPDGLVMNQAKLTALLKGNTATGAPALETLVINARDAVNVFGAVDFDATSLQRLVLGAPAIYGYGAVGDVATIRAGEFIWTGADRNPGAPVAALLGHGTLDIAARSIVFGYGPVSRPVSTAVDSRLALGFANLNLTASERVSASGKSSLAVYETRGDYVSGAGWQYGGGALSLTAPLVTGAAASAFDIKAGGNVTIAAPAKGVALPTIDALGAQLSIAGANIALDGAVVLPSGRLTLTATGDIALGDTARIDLAGREIALFDVKKYSWGGDLALTSTGGNIVTAAGSTIDLSARNNRGGTISVTALSADAGHVDLAGSIEAGATGRYDAGGTIIPYDAGELTLRAQTLTDFAGLNGRLNAGDVFGARRFQIKQGDLVVGDGVKAREVAITIDGGALTVNGKIDASGEQVGSIRLAAGADLTVNGTLDAHGTGLRVDSYGKIIDSPNRAVVALTSRAGTLTLGGTAKVDLRAGTAAAGYDGVARGTLDLNAARLGSNDVAIAVSGPIVVQGAKTIAVNAFRTYDDAPLAALPDVTGAVPQLVTQGYLDMIDGHSRSFMDAALGNAALGGRLSGLGSYHLRPGVEIVSATPNGPLTVVGDIDLSNYRYGPGADRENPSLRGMGEPGMLVLRAGGDLNIHGSINDGFAPPVKTPDEAGWVLREGDVGVTGVIIPKNFGGDIVVPIDGVVLDTGTTFGAGTTLNYDAPLAGGLLPAGTVLPVQATLAAPLVLAAGTVVQAAIRNADGSLAYAAGTVLHDGATLEAGMMLGAGTALRTVTSIAALTWPKGIRIPLTMTTTAPVTLARGSLIPSSTIVQLLGDAPVDLRPSVNGVQGRNWAVAEMLGEGATSWGLQLTAGSDLSSADVRAVNPTGTGSIRLADTHYAVQRVVGGIVIGLNERGVAAVIAAAGGLPSGINDASELIGKTEAELVQLYAAFSFEDFGLPADFFDPASGNILKGLTQQGADTLNAALGGYLPDGFTSFNQLIGLTDTQIFNLYSAFSWDDYGLPGFWDYGTGNSTTLTKPSSTTITGSAFSVLRTGTGDLSLVAAGDIRMDSLYGVYTAGGATRLTAAYDQARGTKTDGSVLGSKAEDYAAALAGYHAWYPDQGGNLLIRAGGDLIGDIRHSAGDQDANASLSTSLVGNWLWRQGSGSAATDAVIPTSWWVNFGTYARLDDGSDSTVEPISINGFTGFGTLGGGNVSIRVGGDAGKIDTRGAEEQGLSTNSRSEGLVVAVGSSGRVDAAGALTLTGGGDLDMRIAGALNPLGEIDERTSKAGLGGTIVNLRGATHVDAASLGLIRTRYLSSGSPTNPVDPRGAEPYAQSSAQSLSGLVLVPGDSTMAINTLGDMVVAGAGDATRGATPNASSFAFGGTAFGGGGDTLFTLWTDRTAIDLTAAGGNMAPSRSVLVTGGTAAFFSDLADTWPTTLRVAALGGNIYFGAAAGVSASAYTHDMLAPSVKGELAVLAAGSIYATGRLNDGTWARHGLVQTATGTPLPTPINPAFSGSLGTYEDGVVTNISSIGGSFDPLTGAMSPVGSLFAFGLSSANTAAPRDPAVAPTRIYAVGDIVGLGTGEVVKDFSNDTISYNAGAPLRMLAGRDIVSSGTFDPIGIVQSNLIVHSNVTDISLVSAGRDILYSNFQIAGPGTLEVTAGRTILEEDRGSFTSIGPIAVGDTRPGASIALMAGMANGVDWGAVRNRYLEPANLADPARPLADSANSGKAVKIYDKELVAWLGGRYGFTGSSAQALAYFDGLAPEQQRVFLREVYYAEARAGGREYNDPASPRFASYLRGREMIATLFPDKAADGSTITRTGDIVLFGGSGVRTNFGGDIEMLAPGGQIVVGVQGAVPPSTAGVVTQGQGDIRLFSQNSLLLGLSRIMTTFGGDIFAWSEQGDINAGRGAKTTVVYTPPKRAYDAVGNVTLAPQVPSTGAGIATLNPVPEVAPGDVDLIAPLGTIDAGEAGIRVSGNVNLAALQVLNAANIQVKGDARGIPLPAVVNTGALTAASNASTAVIAQATQLAEHARPQSLRDMPAIITSRLLGFGD